jgi:RND family efflux transporter MFP subunit
MKKALIILGIVIVIGAVAAIVINRAKPEPAATAVVGPATMEAKKGSVSVVVEGAAIMEAYQQVTLRAAGNAVLTSIKRSGQPVEKDGVVATLDDSSLKNSRSQAELSLMQAELDAERARLALLRARKDAQDTKALVESKAASQDKLELADETAKNAEIASETAEVKVRMARLTLDKARLEAAGAVVRAPFAGTVLKTFAEAGDLLGTNNPIALFGDVAWLRLTAEVDEFDIGKLAVGQQVTISGDSIGEESLRSRIESISPIAEIVNNISIFTVSAVVQNEAGTLRPGMSADFSILIQSDKGLVVPSKSVSTVRGRSYIDVLENGEAVKKRVEIGANDGVNLVILSGIEEGELVIIPGAVPTGAVAAPAASATAEKSVLPITIPGSGGKP